MDEFFESGYDVDKTILALGGVLRDDCLNVLAILVFVIEGGFGLLLHYPQPFLEDLQVEFKIELELMEFL